MQNWFIAAFEAAGIWTHDQAEHVSKEIRLHIHKENYKEAVRELTSILQHKSLDQQSLVHRLESRVSHLEAELKALKEAKPETVAKTKKV